MKFRRSTLAQLLALGLLSGAVSASQHDPRIGYYRTPALHDQTLVFTAEGDLWTKDLASVQAQRLTSLPAEEVGATISPDGQQVAYVANYAGAAEVYVIGIHGGQAKRVSFENSRVRVQGWTADGQILYSTDNGVGPANYWVLRTVNPQTLATEDIPLADAIEGAVDAQGKYIYFTRFGLQATGDNAKVYRGGAKGELWRFQLGSQQEATRLTTSHQGSVRQPMIWQERLYFISDQDGNDNIWSMTVAGSDVKQHTQYEDWQVRSARMDQGRIVFQLGADIHLLDLASQQVSEIDTELTSDFAQRRAHWVQEPMKYIEHVAIAPLGNKAVITARGHVAVAGKDGSRLVQIGDGQSRIRSAIASDDGKWVYGISDASGEQEIWRYAADGSADSKALTHDSGSMRLSLNLSPDGRYIAHDDYDGNVWLLDLKKQRNRKIITNGEGLGPYADIVWSADSQMLALTKAEIGSPRTQIVLYSLKDGKNQAITSNKYESYSPSFSADGQWLYFLSNREFTATPTSPWGDRNLGPMFDKRTQIFAVALDQKAAFPFKQPDELTAVESSDDEEASKQSRIDWQGLSARLWQVPVTAGNYSNLSLVKDKLYMLEHSAAGGAPSLKVVKFSPLAPKVDTFADDVADFQLSSDGSQMLVRKHSDQGKTLLLVDTGDKIAADLAQAKVQTQNWQLMISPMNEWQQMFEDAWLMHRDSFYDKKMRGVDWLATKAKYQPLVTRLTDRHELNDIFKQMMGELNALHSQVRGGDAPKNADRAQAASLGARLKQTSKGVVINHIYQHDPELPQMAPPLARIEVDAHVGDVIVALNGKAVATVADVTRLLSNQADKQVLLTLKRAGKQHKTIVKPVSIATNAKMRYGDWVNHNSELVTDKSQGKMGYLHLYAMGANDIASFAREFYANYQKQGLIVDVRRNRGGNIDSWIIEKLLRRTWAFWQPTHGTPSGNMQQTFRGHLVVLTDQLTYSDGETFAAGIKALGVAPLIGKQTSGAGVWLSGRNRLADKGMARVAEYPQYAMDGSWIIEGRGVSPDIEVDNLPVATFNGQDAQLMRAIDYLSQAVSKAPVKPLRAKPIPADGMANDVHKQ